MKNWFDWILGAIFITLICLALICLTLEITVLANKYIAANDTVTQAVHNTTIAKQVLVA
jgi:hypothetical protein